MNEHGYESASQAKLTGLVQRSPAALFALGVVFALAGAAAVVLPGGSTYRGHHSAEWVDICGWAAIAMGVVAALVGLFRMMSGRSDG